MKRFTASLFLFFACPLFASVHSIRLGGAHTVALTEHAEVLVWGENSRGALGMGDEQARFEPAKLNSLKEITQIAAGQHHTCVLSAKGEVRCWGLNRSFQIGLGILDWFIGTKANQQAVSLATISLGGVPQKIVLGANHSCALFPGGVKCWGANEVGQLGAGTSLPALGTKPEEMGAALPYVDTGESVKDIVLGEKYTCALLQSSRVKCWGIAWINGSGKNIGTDPQQLGKNLLPVPLGSQGVVQIAGGNSHMCALLSDGTTRCWGKNSGGVLGIGMEESHVVGNIPEDFASLQETELEPGLRAHQLACGGFHCCALLENQGVKCWGRNFSGQLGIGDQRDRGVKPHEMGINLPYLDLGTLQPIRSLSAGGAHTCALFQDGNLKCWGANPFGQIARPPFVSKVGSSPNDMGKNLPFLELK